MKKFKTIYKSSEKSKSSESFKSLKKTKFQTVKQGQKKLNLGKQARTCDNLW